MGILKRLFGSTGDRTRTPLQGAQGNLHIVGEESYKPAIARLLKAHGRDHFIIELIPEPSNSHDKNAVKVVADGEEHVGYLSRACARAWQPRITAANAEGFAVTGLASIFGGTKNKPNLGVFGHATWPGKDSPPDF